MSESHQRQLLIAGENPQKFTDFFSNEFFRDFMDILKRRFGTKRVHNNVVCFIKVANDISLGKLF